MNTDGNLDALNRHIAEREEHDERRDVEQELQDLRDEVDALVAKLAVVEWARDNYKKWWIEADNRAEAAETALATARNDALEEAANAIDKDGKYVRSIGLSDRIRALTTEGKDNE